MRLAFARSLRKGSIAYLLLCVLILGGFAFAHFGLKSKFTDENIIWYFPQAAATPLQLPFLLMQSARAAKPKTPDDYLAAVSDEKRAALEKLRKAVKAAAPEAEECISYQLPAFRLNGKLLVACGAAANHCAFYPGSVMKALKNELKDYDTSKGTIRFPAEKPLPAALVRRLVKLRIAKNRGPRATQPPPKAFARALGAWLCSFG